MLGRNEIVKFFSDVSKRFEQFCASLDSSGETDSRSWDTPMGCLDLTISRGDIFEKAGSIYCDLQIETPPVLAEKLGQKGAKAEAFVLEINCYPINPHLPRGYMELRVNITDKIVLAGGTDIFPYFPDDEEANYFAEGMKLLCPPVPL